MTDHEKRIREALEAHQHMLRCGHSHSYALDMALRYFSMPDDLRALLADLDAMREALGEAEEWVQEYVTQMRSYVISDSAAKSLTRIRNALKGAEA